MSTHPTPNTGDNCPEGTNAGSPRAREISDFLAALRHRSENPTGSDNADLVAWKSSLLDRIASGSEDPEVHDVAANARAQLDQVRGDASGSGGEA